jgi:hypothetical protein
VDTIDLVVGGDGFDPASISMLSRGLRTLLDATTGLTPVVFVHLERSLHEPEVEVSPHLASLYLPGGALPPDIADELGAHLTVLIRRIRGDDGQRLQGLPLPRRKDQEAAGE